ncbi:MAG: hypothetical protein D6675_12350 [Gemmatimonadetes bacterium]|nr:MAG: hypothetical protein D6675_12350 [Gemmatimonadota bacterium]
MNIKKWLGHWGFRMAVLYTSFVLFLAGFAIFSMFFPFDLVAKDYYEQDLKYQQQIDRIQRTRALPGGLKCTYNPERDVILITYPAYLDQEQIRGEITLFRPANAAYDRTIPVDVNSEGTQRIDTTHLPKGLWRVKILWQAGEDEYYNEEVVVLQ